jgi:hypothetical protein
MAENKTKPTSVSAEEFLAAVEHPRRRADGFGLLDMMRHITGQEAVMWGPTIVGFGTYHYKYGTGREGDADAVGFSPRKASLVLYGLTEGPDAAELLSRLGKHKTALKCHVSASPDTQKTPAAGEGNGGSRAVQDCAAITTTCLRLRPVRSQRQRRRADGRWPGMNRPT